MKALAATANALLLHKCIKQRMWDNSNQECRQLPGIGRLLSDRLTAAGLGKLRDLETADARVIESVTQRHYPFGTHSHLPRNDAQFSLRCLSSCIYLSACRPDALQEIRSSSSCRSACHPVWS